MATTGDTYLCAGRSLPAVGNAVNRLLVFFWRRIAIGVAKQGDSASRPRSMPSLTGKAAIVRARP
jgi:hypothetical protein